jgi:glycosyltransferase involved in cell wall biosynthesis
MRESLRKDLGIPKNAFVIGHVGNFLPVKNHFYLIELFSELINFEPNSFLCLVGDGKLRNDIEKKIIEKKIEGQVLMLGLRDDVNKLMSAFDILILPSLFEGMPNVVIEAQAASLPCVISNTITREVDMGLGIVEFLSLKDKHKIWIDKIMSKRETSRGASIKIMKEKGYDIDAVVDWLENFYIDVLSGKQ